MSDTIKNWSALFSYDRVSGDLLWKGRALESFDNTRNGNGWNKRWTGKVAGRRAMRHKSANRHAILVNLGKKMTVAHRIVWEMMNGPIPDGMVIDHKNGDPWDNRLENLRLATPSDNSANSKRPRHNSTGFKGVSFDKRSQKFVAYIKHHGKPKHLGSFHTAKEAHDAYCAAATELKNQFAKFN